MHELNRIIQALDNIAAELERLRVLKEHEIGVRVEDDEHGPYVPARSVEE
jgi:hypothetical protein